MNLNEVEDVYPSRIKDVPEILPRKDPVLCRDPSVPLGPLTADQLRQFERDGFLFLDSFFTASDVQAFREELQKLAESPDVKASEGVITEPGSGEVRSIFDVGRHSLTFFALSREPRIVEMIKQILDDDLYIHQSRVNLKPGFRGKEFYWHSDFETWHVEDGMPRMRAVSCSITLTENTPNNGPLMLIPGSHRHYIACVGKTPEDHYKQSLKNQEYGVPDNESLPKIADEGGIVAPIGPAGSVVLFDSNTMHGSNSNITPYPRSNVFFVYNAVSNALVEPFGKIKPRPEFLGSRDFHPITTVEINNLSEVEVIA